MRPKSIANTAFDVLRENQDPTLELAKRHVAKGWAVTPVRFRPNSPC